MVPPLYVPGRSRPPRRARGPPRLATLFRLNASMPLRLNASTRHVLTPFDTISAPLWTSKMELAHRTSFKNHHLTRFDFSATKTSQTGVPRRPETPQGLQKRPQNQCRRWAGGCLLTPKACHGAPLTPRTPPKASQGPLLSPQTTQNVSLLSPKAPQKVPLLLPKGVWRRPESKTIRDTAHDTIRDATRHVTRRTRHGAIVVVVVVAAAAVVSKSCVKL